MLAATRKWFAEVGNSIASVFALAFSKGVPQRSSVIALVVGTVLTLINQGTLLFSGIIPPLWKIGLTFLVPYLVSTFGAVTAMRAAAKKAAATPPDAGNPVKATKDTRSPNVNQQFSKPQEGNHIVVDCTALGSALKRAGSVPTKNIENSLEYRLIAAHFHGLQPYS